MVTTATKLDLQKLTDDLATGRIGPRGALERIAESHGVHRFDPADLRFPITPEMKLTTSDYSSAMSVVAEKFLLPFAGGYVPSWPKWAARSTLNRLTGKAVSLSPVAGLSRIYEGGESPSAIPDDAGSDVAIVRYGDYASLTWEATLADDLAAFKSSLNQLGNAARMTEDDVAYAALIAGAGSLAAASSAGAPTAARVDSCRTALAAKTHPVSGLRLNTKAAVLVCPVALASQAAVAVFETNQVNDEKIMVVSDGRLDASSAAQWYLFASPAILPSFTVTFLAGLESPQLETTEGDDSQTYHVRHHVGATSVGTDGAVRNAGA